MAAPRVCKRGSRRTGVGVPGGSPSSPGAEAAASGSGSGGSGLDPAGEIRAGHAHRVIEAVQTQLRRWEGTKLKFNTQMEMYCAQRMALNALWSLHASKAGAHAAAKQVQLDVSRGRPLAVCVGKIDVGALGAGCGKVFPDAVDLRGQLWAIWCPDCRNNSITKRKRSAARAIRRLKKLDMRELGRERLHIPS